MFNEIHVEDGGVRIVPGSSARRKECPVCGIGFWPIRRSKVYCSAACRQAAYRERQAIAEGRELASGPNRGSRKAWSGYLRHRLPSHGHQSVPDQVSYYDKKAGSLRRGLPGFRPRRSDDHQDFENVQRQWEHGDACETGIRVGLDDWLQEPTGGSVEVGSFTGPLPRSSVGRGGAFLELRDFGPYGATGPVLIGCRWYELLTDRVGREVGVIWLDDGPYGQRVDEAA